MEQATVYVSAAQMVEALDGLEENGSGLLHNAPAVRRIVSSLVVVEGRSNSEPGTAVGTAGDTQIELCALIRAARELSEDLDTVAEALAALRDLVAVPPYLQLSWRPAPCGVGQWRIYVEGMMSRGWVTKILRGYSVSQVGFDNVKVETKEEGFDLLLKREWSARQAGRAEQALAQRRGILEQRAVYDTTEKGE